MASGSAVGQPLTGHTEAVRCVAMNRDGSRIISGSHDGTVQVWDVRSGEAVGEPLVAHTDTVRCLAMSGDGSRAASGSHDYTIRVWDVENGVAVGQSLIGHTGWVWCLAMNDDGSRIVSGAWDDTIRVLEMQDGRAIGAEMTLEESVILVGMDADDSYVVSVGVSGEVRVWDARNGNCVCRGSAWKSFLSTRWFSWSSCEALFVGSSNKIVDRSENGDKVVLGTREEPVQRIDDICFSAHLKWCHIIR